MAAVKNTTPAGVPAEAERNKNLEIAIAQIEKEFGKGSIMRLGDSATYAGDVQVISTGALALDLALGIGGLPKGRIVEIFGPESSGKTTVCLHVIDLPVNPEPAGTINDCCFIILSGKSHKELPEQEDIANATKPCRQGQRNQRIVSTYHNPTDKLRNL